MQIKPIKNKIILRPNASRMRGGIFVPDDYAKHASTACLVVAKGDRINPQIKQGSIVLCKTGIGTRKEPMNEHGDFWATEDHIYGLHRDNQIFPYGKKVLIRRDIKDVFTEGGIQIPQRVRYQSLTGTIVQLGIFRGYYNVNGLEIGAKIRLTDWHESMLQVDLEDGSHGMIVDQHHILYREN